MYVQQQQHPHLKPRWRRAQTMADRSTPGRQVAKPSTPRMPPPVSSLDPESNHQQHIPSPSMYSLPPGWPTHPMTPPRGRGPMADLGFGQSMSHPVFPVGRGMGPIPPTSYHPFMAGGFHPGAMPSYGAGLMPGPGPGRNPWSFAYPVEGGGEDLEPTHNSPRTPTQPEMKISSVGPPSRPPPNSNSVAIHLNGVDPTASDYVAPKSVRFAKKRGSFRYPAPFPERYAVPSSMSSASGATTPALSMTSGSTSHGNTPATSAAPSPTREDGYFPYVSAASNVYNTYSPPSRVKEGPTLYDSAQDPFAMYALKEALPGADVSQKGAGVEEPTGHQATYWDPRSSRQMKSWYPM